MVTLLKNIKLKKKSGRLCGDEIGREGGREGEGGRERQRRSRIHISKTKNITNVHIN